MRLDSLEKLLAHELKDLYSAEKQILEALPAVIDAASDDDLKEALRQHEKQTQRHVERLERVFEGFDFKPSGQRCRGMEGLLEEARDIIKSDAEPEVRDAAIIAAAQRVEHYEIAAYGVARTFAEKLGRYDASDVLQETLNEEAMADQKLTRLAERKINFEAMRA